MESSNPTFLDLRDGIAVLRRRWPIAVLLALMGGVLGFFVENNHEPLYQSQAVVFVDFESGTELVNPGGNQSSRDPDRALQNEVLFLKGDTVLSRLAEDLGYIPRIAAAAATRSDTLTFSATSNDAAGAANGANAYALLYIKMRAERSLSNSGQAVAALRSLIDGLQAKLDAIPSTPATIAERAALQSQIRLYDAQATTQSVTEATLASGASILSKAQPADRPFFPHPFRQGAIGAALGLMVGIGLAILLEYLDDSLRGPEALARLTPDLTLLGTIPRAVADARKSPALAVPSQLSESFRTLRTSIQFAGLRRPLRSLQVTAANPSEGKTTIACHLAVSLAHAGERVVLVDGDLRNPSVHQRMGLSNDFGVSSVVLRQIELHEALQGVDGVSQLSVLTSGPSPGNAADFLWPANLSDDVPTLNEIIQRLTGEGAFVVLDSPPVLPVADAMTLSRMVDGTLLVVRAHETGARQLQRALERLAQADARLIGEVMNVVEDDLTGHGYGYGYAPAVSGWRRWFRRSRHHDDRASQRSVVSRDLTASASQPTAPATDASAPAELVGIVVGASMAINGTAKPAPPSEPMQHGDVPLPTGNEPASSAFDEELIARLRAHLGISSR